MTIPPYTIPDADADLWDCGVSPWELLLRTQKACCDCKTPFLPSKTALWRCPTCHTLKARLDYTRRKVVLTAPRESIVLTEDQVRRLEKAYDHELRYLGRLRARPLDPADGFRLAGLPWVGIRRVFVGSGGWRGPEACRDALHKVVVESHEGAAMAWIRAQAREHGRHRRSPP